VKFFTRDFIPKGSSLRIKITLDKTHFSLPALLNLVWIESHPRSGIYEVGGEFKEISEEVTHRLDVYIRKRVAMKNRIGIGVVICAFISSLIIGWAIRGNLYDAESSMTTSRIREINCTNFSEAIKGGIVLGDFWAPEMSDILYLDTIAQELDHNVKIATVNIDKAELWGIRVIYPH
jgi:hypothetical protein